MGTRKDTNRPIEMKIAVQYWTQAVRQKLANEMATKFEQALTTLLYEEKIKNHWHIENPRKGQAHRSLSLDRMGKPEPVLLKAGRAIGLGNIFDVFPSSMESIWMWIDPGEVVVRTFYAFAQRPTEEVLFRTASSPSSTATLSPSSANSTARSSSPTPPPIMMTSSEKVDFALLSKLSAPHHSDEFWQDALTRRRSPSPTAEPFIPSLFRSAAASSSNSHSTSSLSSSSTLSSSGSSNSSGGGSPRDDSPRTSAEWKSETNVTWRDPSTANTGVSIQA